MARDHDDINFRDMWLNFLLVKDIDENTREVIEKSDYRIRQKNPDAHAK